MVGGLTVQARTTSRAVWVWDSTALLRDASVRREFLEFTRARGIDIAWIQVALSPAGNSLQHEDLWRELLQDANLSGLEIHALDGDPAHARRERHYVVLGLVDAIVRFNRHAPADARFEGIHLDNEPYLLAGWELPVIRQQLLAEYLELNARVHRAVRAEGDLEFGVDIPFWWPSPEVLDLVDNAGIMDYRNVAGGTDGIIALGRPLLEYGNRTRAKIFVGVETSPAASLELPKLTFDGRSNAEMEHELALAHAAFAANRSYAGFAIHHYVSYRQRFPDEIPAEER
jgi:hypothetical protein